MSVVETSIIIVTCDREPILWKSVSKAIEATEGMPAEIIIVNEGYSNLIIPDDFSKRIICFNNFQRGISSARNAGAIHAKGKILFFIDDDMWINREIIRWIYLHLIQNKETDAVYNINWEYPSSLNEKLRTSKVGKYILSSDYHTMWGRMHENGKRPAGGLYKFNAIASCSLVLSKELFNRIGGYNESITFQGEDIEYANRINQLLIPIYCVFDVTLYHNHEDRLDLKGFLERIHKGYYSQFMAEKRGLIPLSSNNYNRSRIYIFNLFLLTETIWIHLYKLLPNDKFFERFVNKLVGYLAGLEKFRQWKTIFIRSNISRR